VSLPDMPADQCACWRWASTGFAADIVHDPAAAFSNISEGIPIQAGSVWGQEYYAQAFQQKHSECLAYVDANYAAMAGKSWSAWFDEVTDGIAREMCRLANLNPALGAAPLPAHPDGVRYYVMMKYERANGINTTYGPNYTHWWLKIDLGHNLYVCIETFPLYNHLTFRWNNAHANHDVLSIEVNDLNAAHIAILNAIVGG
jgi:hypothetical protein